MSTYYNEIDPFCCEWLRNLMAAGHITAGEIDSRSIVEVQPDDVRGFTRCHFFAGLGGWDYALRLAGWPDARPVWTGSCPCQPFSAAGKREGHQDERHLWPAWARLIGECRPCVVFGEQVSGTDGLAWLDAVCADLEAMQYAVGPLAVPACSVGAPHIRERLWFVADADQSYSGRRGDARGTKGEGLQPRTDADGCGVLGELADAECGRSGARRASRANRTAALESDRHGTACDLAESAITRPQGGDEPWKRDGAQRSAVERSGAAGGMADQCGIGTGADSRRPLVNWKADLLRCRDGLWRPVEPGTFPLAHGVSARVGRLRAYGNAICAPLAAEVIGAFMECRP